MEIGIDSFAANNNQDNTLSMKNLIERIKCADKYGLDVFGVGEHHREDFLDSAPTLILSAAATLTKNIRLATAVTVLSAADPVRVFQQHATLDLISKGRAEIVAGRGSFSEAFPLFGYRFNDYDALFDEKLRLLLSIRESLPITWKGQFRPPLNQQYIYPRPIQKKLPIWVGIGGTPESAIRAAELGCPLMIAIIGGQTARFRSLVDIYKHSWKQYGHPPEDAKVGIHSLGYVADTTEKAHEEFFPGYQKVFTKIGLERGWGPVTRAHFDQLVDEEGALVVGDSKNVIEKIIRHSKSLGGLSRFTFQMNVAELDHQKLMHSIKLIGEKVRPELENI